MGDKMKLSLKDGSFLKAKDLEEGCLYLIKDGRLLLYLGKDIYKHYLFYGVASCLYTEGYRVAHSAIQIKYLVDVSKEVMRCQLDKTCLIPYKGIPQIFCKFPFIDFKSDYAMWYDKSRKLLGGLPERDTGLNGVDLYIKPKDLVLGELYYTGDSWRSLFCYLGRGIHGGYLWFFIGNIREFMSFPLGLLFSEAEETKQCKKVKALKNIYQDPDSIITDEIKYLVGVAKRITEEDVHLYRKRVRY